MSIKSLLTTFAAALLISPVCAAADDNAANYGSDPKISDLALIYAGNIHRPEWTKEQLQPYVTHVYADGHEEWFFDAFLFLEFSKGDIAYQNGLKLTPGTQSDWQDLLNIYFAENRTLHALDQLIEEKKQTLGDPTLRHRVVISCCAPTKHPTGKWTYSVWGKYNGNDIRLYSQEGRINAVKWYVDRVLEMWQQADFKNIELEGLYWIEEGLYTNGEIVPDINDYIHSKGLRSYWIPYYTNNKQYWSEWKNTYKFDMCYIQPNYAFLDDAGNTRPYSLLTSTVEAAKEFGMGLELEFETQAKSNALHSVNPTLHQHINDYMDVFDSEGVFSHAGIAYYSGTQGFIHMDKSTDPVDHQTIDRMARFVAERQKAKKASASVNEITVPAEKFAYIENGHIVLAPDSCCYDISGRLVGRGEAVIDCKPGMYIANNANGSSVKLFIK